MTTRSRWPSCTGQGEQAFCSGSRFDRPRGAGAVSPPKRTGQRTDGRVRGSCRSSRSITVSQGYTYAGGLELFCHGHIRLAEPQATFSVACRRWGVPLVDGGTVYLPRLLGWGAALPLIITGQRITAERAYADRSRLGACSQPRGARAGVFDGKANLPAAAQCAPGRSRRPRSAERHQPLEAALERRGPQSRPRDAKREHAPRRRIVSGGKTFLVYLSVLLIFRVHTGYDDKQGGAASPSATRREECSRDDGVERAGYRAV